MYVLLVSRHHTPTSYGVNAMYEEVTLPRTPADHKDGGIQAATTKMAMDGYSTPVDVVKNIGSTVLQHTIYCYRDPCILISKWALNRL